MIQVDYYPVSTAAQQIRLMIDGQYLVNEVSTFVTVNCVTVVFLSVPGYKDSGKIDINDLVFDDRSYELAIDHGHTVEVLGAYKIAHCIYDGTRDDVGHSVLKFNKIEDAEDAE